MNMKLKNKMIKILSVLISILFLYSNIGWSVPQFHLRQRAALDRDALGNVEGAIQIRPLGDVFKDDDKRAKAYTADTGGEFKWVLNPDVFNGDLTRCTHNIGVENVVVVYELCAGEGKRFERSEIIELVEKYGLEEELKTELIARVGLLQAEAILSSYETRLRSADYEAVGRQLLSKTGHAEEIIPKVIYPNPLTGRPFALAGREAARNLGLPIAAVVGYQSGRVMEAMGKDDTTFVFQPGFEATAGFIPPGVLGTAYGLAQFTRVVPEDFKGTIFVSMGDAPFIDAEVIEGAIRAYFAVRGERLDVKGDVGVVAIMGQISENPIEASYGRMVFREAQTPAEKSYMLLDRIVEVNDILAMIASATGRKSVNIEDLKDKEELKKILEKMSKKTLLERAKDDANMERLRQQLGGEIDIPNSKIILPGEDEYSEQQLGWRNELDNALRNIGLLREKHSGRIFDGWDLINERFYNTGIYLFDHRALREIIFELENNNNPREYYGTDLPVLLEANGWLTVCVEPAHPWKVECVNTLPELRQRIELIKRSNALDVAAWVADVGVSKPPRQTLEAI